MNYNIKTYNQIAKPGLELLTENGFSINAEPDQPHAILLRSKMLEIADIPASVEVIARAGAGTNNIPTAIITPRGIPVLNTPGANANAVKDLVICAILYHARNIGQALKALHDLDQHDPDYVNTIESIKKRFVGNEVKQKTLGVIGLGAVGVNVANAATALGMAVAGFDPFIQLKYSWMLSAEVKQYHSIEALLQDSDYVSIHIPLNPSTKHLLNAQLLKHCKSSSTLVNFSRGSIACEEDVLAALDYNQLSGYICDFPTPKLLAHHKVTCLPHLGASTIEAEENCAKMAAQQISQYLLEGSIENSINFPEVKLKPLLTPRLCVINQNIPGMVSKITELISAEYINVITLSNTSKEDIAYTVIDIETPLKREALEKIQSIPGIIRVRQLLPKSNKDQHHANLLTSKQTT